MKIIQKRGEKRKEFELINDKLKIKEKGFLNSKEWSLDIEYIGHNILIENHSKKGVNIIGFFFVSIAILCWIGLYIEGNPDGKFDGLIWGSIFMLFMGILCFKAPMNNKLILSGNNSSLTFFLDSPSRKKVEEYVNKLIEISKLKLSQKYSRIDYDIPEDVYMGQLTWLLNNDIISNTEYEKKKEDYKVLKLLK
tara:strand:+ start:1043 stop:1624 length:582 start_codon:yes stop_codon:yes gene_type:complete